MLFVGVDLGTSAVKLLLMDENGKIKNIVSKEYPLYFPHPGWSEQKPEDWFAQSMEGLKELLEGFDKDQVKGISFGGQMHGLVALDKEDKVIRPAILWNDGRTAKQTDYLNQVIGKEKLSEYTANIAFAGFTAPKILWMKENEPENFANRIKSQMILDLFWGSHCGSICDHRHLFIHRENRNLKYRIHAFLVCRKVFCIIYHHIIIVGTAPLDLCIGFAIFYLQ